MKKGYVLLDIRTPSNHKDGHPKGAINVPLFQPVTKNDFWNNLKKVVSGFMAMAATRNFLI